VIRENMDIFKRNGFEFIEEQQLQRKHTGQHQAAAAAAASGSGNAAETANPPSSPSAAVAGDADGNNAAADAADAAADEPPGELLLSAVPLMRGAGASGVLGEEALTELLDLLATGEKRAEDVRPKR
jgi:hypothetical protein